MGIWDVKKGEYLMNRKKIILICLFIIFLIALVFLVNYAMDLNYYKKAMETIEIESVDILKLEDCMCAGSYDARIISATVQVTIKDGIITNIEIIEHKNEKGGAAEIIVEKILAEQTLEVDVISGATNSSKVILKAVENALTNYKNE